MNRVTIIQLNGNAYQREESGYEALRSYLDNAARRLEGNPDKDEIIADIEQAIAEKFRALLGASNSSHNVSHSTDVKVGPINVNAPQAKDAHGIADAIVPSLKRAALAQPANSRPA